jgi:hypothetical protein
VIDKTHFIGLYYPEIMVVGIVLNEVVEIVESQPRDSIKMMVWKVNAGNLRTDDACLFIPLHQRSSKSVLPKQRRMNLSMVPHELFSIGGFLGVNAVSLIMARLLLYLYRETSSRRKNDSFCEAGSL